MDLRPDERMVGYMPEDDSDRDNRDESGRFSSEISDQMYLDLLEEHGQMTAKEVSEELEVPKRTALYRLGKLAESGQVTRSRFSQTDVWAIGDE